MKALKGLLIFLALIVIIGLVLPVKMRNGYYYFSVGRMQELTGNSAQASKSYQSAAGSMPENITFVRLYARSLNDLGDQLENEDYFDQAYSYTLLWESEHEAHPDRGQILIEHARALWGLGRRPAAKTAIEEAVSLMPTDYEALVYEGIMFRDIRPENSDAIRASLPIFEQAIDVRRRNRVSWAQYELAVAYWMLNNEAQALNHVNLCLDQFPPKDLKADAERLKHEIQSGGRSER